MMWWILQRSNLISQPGIAHVAYIARNARRCARFPNRVERPRFSSPVAEASQASPLPEVTVRRINGDGGWAQFKNEIPSELPLLDWFWAPH